MLRGCLKLVAVLVVVVAVGFAALFRISVLTPVHYRPVDLTGKLAVVTGATSGLGLETVKRLTAWNATVIAPVRNMNKGAKVRDEVLAALPAGSTGSLELAKCDIASFKSVRAFAEQLLASSRGVDILMLNAGVGGPQSTEFLRLSEDKVEETYQINHLSHFLLTRLLLPALRSTASGTARVVHVSSGVQAMGEMDHEAYSATARNADPATSRVRTGSSYLDTKLFQVVFSNMLDRKLRGTGVTSVSLHPGFVITPIDGSMEGESFVKTLLVTFRPYSRAVEDGAVTQVTLATHPSLLSKGGLYYEDQCIMNGCTSCWLCSVAPGGGVVPHPAANNVTEQEWLWKTSSEIVGLEP